MYYERSEVNFSIRQGTLAYQPTFLATISTQFFCHAIAPKRHETGIVAMGGESEVVCDLSNGTIFNDPEWP